VALHWQTKENKFSSQFQSNFQARGAVYVVCELRLCSEFVLFSYGLFMVRIAYYRPVIEDGGN